MTGPVISVGESIAAAILGGFSEKGWQGLIGFAASGLCVGVVGSSISRMLQWRANGKLMLKLGPDRVDLTS